MSWIDELRRSPALELTDALVVVRNGLLHHDLRVDATPQPAWGERFSLRARLNQPLMARAGEWRLWRGTVHADLPHVDVALLRRYVDLPFELREGRGALRAWLEVADGRADGATVDLALRNVALRLSAQVAPMEFESLRARLDGEQGDRRARVAARRLTFTTADGVLWPESEIEASWRLAPAGSAPGDAAPEIVAGEFSADRLDVALLASLASRVPLSEGVRKMLIELAPRGTVHGLVARWDGPIDAPRQYQVRARMKGLSIAAAPAVDGVGRPGWLNADIDLQASELGGDARLSLADGALEFPGVFDRPVVPLRRFDAQLVWRIGAARPNGRSIELQVKEARFDNDDASGELALRWRTGDGAGFGRAGRFPGLLDLQGKLTGGQATSVARYLPRGLPKPGARLRAARGAGGQGAERNFQGQGRPVGLSVLRRQESARRRISHRRPVCRPDAGLCAQPPGRRRRRTGMEFAVAGHHPGRRRAGRRAQQHVDSQCAGPHLRRRVARRARRGARFRPSADARAGRPGPRPAGRHAALRQRHAGGRVDRRRAGAGHGARSSRPAAGAQPAAGAAGAVHREGQRAARRQRHPPASRHAAAGGGARAGRLLAARLADRRRVGACAGWRGHRRRRHAARRRLAIQPAGHRHGRRAASNGRARPAGASRTGAAGPGAVPLAARLRQGADGIEPDKSDDRHRDQSATAAEQTCRGKPAVEGAVGAAGRFARRRIHAARPAANRSRPAPAGGLSARPERRQPADPARRPLGSTRTPLLRSRAARCRPSSPA